MNSLREIEAFTGVTTNAGQHFHVPLRRASIRSVGDIVPLLSSSEQTSMRAMIEGLQRLPPISLDAATEQDTDTDFPPSPDNFGPIIRVHPSSGVVLETRLNYFLNGQPLHLIADNLLDGLEVVLDTPIHFTFRVPGAYVAVVTRTGITNAGVAVLEKRFPFAVTAKAPPPEPEPEPPPLVPPFIAVKSNGDGSFTVSGKKFVPNATVTIRVVDAVQPLSSPNLFFTVSATPEGKLEDFPTGKICQIPGGRIVFSAQDGRIDAGQAITSNFVEQTCPFPK